MMIKKQWKRGYTMITAATRTWRPEEIGHNDRIESMRIFSDFSETDEGKSRQLVCRVNPEHPDAEANAKRIANAPEFESFVHNFSDGIDHFLDCLDLGKCALDARAISWLNDMLNESKTLTSKNEDKQ